MRRLSEIAVCFLSFPLFFGSRARSELPNTRAKMVPDDKENRVATETDSLGNFFGAVFAQIINKAIQLAAMIQLDRWPFTANHTSTASHRTKDFFDLPDYLAIKAPNQ